MVKVFTGRSLAACISATTVLESSPPDRNAPSGTSDTIAWRTASDSVVSSAASAAAASSSVAASAGSAVARSAARQ